MKPDVKAFFDPETWTLSYVASDPESRDAVVIDAVLDYDPAPSRIRQDSIERVAAFLRENDLRPRLILDTHAHADHFSGSRVLKERFPDARIGIGEHIRDVQRTFRTIFNLGQAFDTEGGQFDALLVDGEVVAAGTLPVRVIATPGHTPACVCYLIGDALFSGDTLFMPDYGVGRCDFPAGSAEHLYDSIVERLYTLPDRTRVFVGHDYQPGGRDLMWETTIGQEKLHNVQLKAGTPRDVFVRLRQARDRTLGAPRLLFPSVQFNINGGQMPAAEPNGMSYLKIPLRG
ncbi:MAG: MBL fold metallo-hydrolase [Burkholderiales bacterium]